MCSKATCSTTNSTCCALYNNRGGCHIAGCTWCGTVCGPVDYGGAGCDAGTLFRVEGDWHTFEYECSGDFCDAAVRTQYLAIYDKCVGPTKWTQSCLATALATVDNRAWPPLATETTYNPGLMYTVRLNSTDSLYLGMKGAGNGAEAVWIPHAKQQVWLVPSSTQKTETHPEYYVYSTPGNSQYCLVAPRYGIEEWQAQVQVLGHRIGGMYWRNIDRAGAFLNPDSYCSSLVLDTLGQNETWVTLGNNQTIIEPIH